MSIENLDREPLGKPELAALVATAIGPGSFVNLASGSRPPSPTTSRRMRAWCCTPRTACSAWGPPRWGTRSTLT